jgi:hypothetical protein
MHRDFGLHLFWLVGSWLLGAVALQPMTARAQNATEPAVVAAQQTSVDVVEKKLFIRQADVYGAYLAYTDHEIGRVTRSARSL